MEKKNNKVEEMLDVGNEELRLRERWWFIIIVTILCPIIGIYLIVKYKNWKDALIIIFLLIVLGIISF